MHDRPYKELLTAEPAPPPELHALLQYLSDAFALLEHWILRPGDNDPRVLRIGCRTHPAAATEAREISTRATRRWHLAPGADRRADEIRIALRDAPGYYVQCPLDSDRKPYEVQATLERTPDDEEPDGARTVEVPVNRETEHLLQMLAGCVSPLRS